MDRGISVGCMIFPARTVLSRWVVILLLGALMPWQIVSGQELSPAPAGGRGSPPIKNFGTDDYRGHVQSWGFAKDSHGIIYVANSYGLMRFNGVEWQFVRMPGQIALSLIYDDDERIYVGGLGEIGYVSVSAPADPSSGNPWHYESLTSLIADTVEFSSVWYSEKTDDGIFYLSNEYFFHYDGERVHAIPAQTRFSHLFTMEGEVYVREAPFGLKKYSGGELVAWEKGSLFGNTTLRSVIELEDGTVLFVTYFGLLFFDGQDFRPFDNDAADYLSVNFIDMAMQLADGTIAIATRNGGIVWLRRDGSLINILTEDSGLISNTVYGLLQDNKGSLWAATINGLSRIDLQLPFRYFDSRHGLSDTANRITSRNDTIFVSGSRGVYIRNSRGESHFFDGMTFCHQFLHHNEDLYVICGGALYSFWGGRFEQVSESVFSTAATTLDREKVVLVHQQGLTVARLSGTELEPVFQATDFNLRPNSATICSSGNIWIGTDTRGLFRVTLDSLDGRIAGYSIKRHLHQARASESQARVYVSVLDGEPLIITNQHGILKYDAASDTLIQTDIFGSDFMNTNRQYLHAIEDPSGNVWFSLGSWFRAAMRQSDGTYEIQAGILNWLDIPQNNHMYSDPQGYVWYVDARKLVRYDPRVHFDTGIGFHTEISEVLVRGDSLVARGGSSNPLVLAYADNELRFTYAAAAYLDPARTRYRVKLEGFDENWSAWTSETRKDYTNIPEGTYRFLVEARNLFGVVSAAESFHVRILPPWYRTWWAYLLYLIATVMVLYTGYRVRVNQLLRVHRIRNRIAGDLHDEISATLSSISFFARAIEDDKFRGDRNRFVKLISDSAGDAKEKITDIVWAINPEHDDWKSFLSKCRRYVSDLMESKGIAYNLQIDEQIPGKLDMQLRQNLWLIFKEMVTNTARHSNATEVVVILNYRSGRFHMHVSDNGRGFDPEAATDGNGLKNIRQRAEQTGARLDLQAVPGEGTCWELVLKL
jgi:signal transduction histidine kinase/ligand-binding sensor domain-containing protein